METPKGWCLVPENPTDAQLAAAQEAWLRDPQRRTSTIYSAALAARPVVKESLTVRPLPHQHCKTHGAAPLNVWACPECLVMLRDENKVLRDTIAALEEKEKRRSKPSKADIKRLSALAKCWEEDEKKYQKLYGNALPTTIRARTKRDSSALRRVLKLLDSGEVA